MLKAGLEPHPFILYVKLESNRDIILRGLPNNVTLSTSPQQRPGWINTAFPSQKNWGADSIVTISYQTGFSFFIDSLIFKLYNQNNE